MSLSERIENLMMSVQKPVRYMGGEFNAVMKDANGVDVRYAFLFPDTYEVGMSHLGMKILYHAINARDDAWCERVFSPWVDMADLMRRDGIPLFTLESRTPVREFDLLGITLQYEMSFTNILEALDLSGIPLRSADRTEGPFIICGGPCAFNPEPLAPFVDLVALGDGEEETQQTINLYKQWKAAGLPRSEYLRMAAHIPGIYVPSLYDVCYNDDGTVRSVIPKPGSGAPEVVKKALVKDLDSATYPEKLIVPYGEIVHNRIMLEIFRGCTRGCRFCQAGMIYRPIRERSVEHLMQMADSLVSSTGYDEISLMSLSSGDYSCLPELAHRMVERFAARRVRISLPSQRIDTVLTDTLKETQKVKKTALTLAPEAGTQRLRDVINKGVTEADLIRSVTDAFEQGWSAVKLYFMLGLPTETDEDVLGIADLAEKVRRCYFSIPKERRAPGLRRPGDAPFRSRRRLRTGKRPRQGDARRAQGNPCGFPRVSRDPLHGSVARPRNVPRRRGQGHPPPHSPRPPLVRRRPEGDPNPGGAVTDANHSLPERRLDLPGPFSVRHRNAERFDDRLENRVLARCSASRPHTRKHGFFTGK